MGHRYSGKKCRLLSMFGLTTIFFLVEIIVGYATNSMALVADSFHMLSDIAALIIAFISVKMAPKSWERNTYGWARAEVLGALVNAVFLMALCFSITVESLKRFYEPEKIEQPILILIVGALGLLVNLLGLCLFHEHGGGGHGHSHGGHGTHGHITALANSNEDISKSVEDAQKNGHDNHKDSSGSQMNMRGVFLHVLGDALGSVIVIISALVIWLTDEKYRDESGYLDLDLFKTFEDVVDNNGTCVSSHDADGPAKVADYIDPALSLFLVCIILFGTWPLLMKSAFILLQTVPTHIDVDVLKKKLLENVDGILAVHDFHVWQLTGNKIIASAHIRCFNLMEYMKVAEEIKVFFHNQGIHSTTIQPEFVDDTIAEDCAIDCPKGISNCEALKCCKTSPNRSPNLGKTNTHFNADSESTNL